MTIQSMTDEQLADALAGSVAAMVRERDLTVVLTEERDRRFSATLKKGDSVRDAHYHVHNVRAQEADGLHWRTMCGRTIRPFSAHDSSWGCGQCKKARP